MEAGGVEPPSEKGTQAVSTCVDRWHISPLHCQRTIAEAASLRGLIPIHQAGIGTSLQNDAGTWEGKHLSGRRAIAF